jgi:DNA-binding CsgD family transcriptional regulator
LDDLLNRIAHETNVAAAITHARDEAIRCGAEATTLHIAAPHGSQVGPGVFIAMHGHSDAWARGYFDAAVRRHDPFPDYVMRSGCVATYQEALSKLALTPAQAAFVDAYHAATLKRTFAMPIYGPFDFDTYATVTLGHDLTEEHDSLVEHLVAVVEAVNRRIAHLLETRTGVDIALSEREAEVLHWIGRSKSNGDIGTILSVSAATVDTYVRRLFFKLGVNDRIAAAVKGIRLGLIRY